MGKAFTFRAEPFQPAQGRRTVLVTGAAGRIGSDFSAQTHEKYELRLMVRGDEPGIDRIERFGEVVRCDLNELAGLNDACRGIDTVLHLAADPRVFAPWEDLLPSNIIGVYNLLEAAKAQSCRRVVFASSINTMNGYPRDMQIRSDDPVNPGNLYGATKCFGEALCRLYATRDGVSAIAIRIGAYQTLEDIQAPGQRIPRHVFVSPRDLTQLFIKSIDDEKLQFAIFQGVSNNRFNKFDTSDARELLGYAPLDDAFEQTTA